MQILNLIKRIDGCKNNPRKSSSTIIAEHIPCRYSLPTIWAFDGIKNRHHE